MVLCWGGRTGFPTHYMTIFSCTAPTEPQQAISREGTWCCSAEPPLELSAAYHAPVGSILVAKWRYSLWAGSLGIVPLFTTLPITKWQLVSHTHRLVKTLTKNWIQSITKGCGKSRGVTSQAQTETTFEDLPGHRQYFLGTTLSPLWKTSRKFKKRHQPIGEKAWKIFCQ